MDHPTITHLEKYGLDEAKYLGLDYFKNEIYEGDDVLVYDDEIILIEEVTKGDLIKLLINLGAEEKTAEK